MRKLLLLLVVFLTTSFIVLAPKSNAITIFYSNPIKRTYSAEAYLQAMIQIESGIYGTWAYNPNEPMAAGILQQYPIFVDDVNKILGEKKYEYADRYNDTKAIEMFWIYQHFYNPKLDVEIMCRIQCGGPTGHLKVCTLPYLQLVKQELYLSEY